jgi:hypothetical protein
MLDTLLRPEAVFLASATIIKDGKPEREMEWKAIDWRGR